MPTKLLAQTVNDSTSVKKEDIRTANQIFAEHKVYKKVIAEQKELISTLSLNISEDALIKYRMSKSLTLKDSTIATEQQIQYLKEQDHKKELKAQKKKTFRAYVIATVVTVVSVLLLAQ